MKMYNFTKNSRKENLQEYQLRYSKSKGTLAKASGSEDIVEISPEAMEKYISSLQEELLFIQMNEFRSKHKSLIKSINKNEKKDLQKIKSIINDEYFADDKKISEAADYITYLLLWN